MKNLNNIKLFNRFLKENNIFKIYYYNLENDDNEDFNRKTIENVYEILKHYNIDEYHNEIHNAFLWCETKQGFRFWEKIEQQWLNVLYKLRKIEQKTNEM